MLPNLYIHEYLQRQQERELRAALLARALYDVKRERHNRLAHQVTRCCRLISKAVTKLWQNGQRGKVCQYIKLEENHGNQP